jgi:hypothetical protein
MVEPSSIALQAHIFDMERDLRNTEFRLQYLYRERMSLLNLLASAKLQADRLKK